MSWTIRPNIFEYLIYTYESKSKSIYSINECLVPYCTIHFLFYINTYTHFFAHFHTYAFISKKNKCDISPGAMYFSLHRFKAIASHFLYIYARYRKSDSVLNWFFFPLTGLRDIGLCPYIVLVKTVDQTNNAYIPQYVFILRWWRCDDVVQCEPFNIYALSVFNWLNARDECAERIFILIAAYIRSFIWVRWRKLWWVYINKVFVYGGGRRRRVYTKQLK